MGYLIRLELTGVYKPPFAMRLELTGVCKTANRSEFMSH